MIACTQSSKAALSRTVRLTPSCTPRPLKISSMAGPFDTRPRLGLKPNRPVEAAGTRMEPAASVAWASGTMPAATAAAAPPLEPPALRLTFHGLRVAPYRTGSVVVAKAISGVLVRPNVARPAARNCVIRWESSAATWPAPRRLPASLRRPAMVTATSLIRNGTPANGAAWSMAVRSAGHSSTTALICGLTAAQARWAASCNSAADTAPWRSSWASPSPSKLVYSWSCIS